MDQHDRSRSALVGLLLVVSIVVTACAALSSPDGLMQTSPPAGEAGGSSGGLVAGDGECSDPGAAGSGAPGATTEPGCDAGDGGAVVDDPDAVATSPPLDPTQPGDPGPPTSTFVEPRPGVIDPIPVFVQGLTASVEDGHVIAVLEWVSGVEPCYTLAEVRVERDGSTFTLTPLEGTTSHDVACIEIAMFKATRVDLGALPSGTYTIRVGEGDAAPVEVAVP